ncbi:MurR/RpiR family transcriptional regulator [Rothia sp. LK2588]|uniref:MurR/RpiR family transcriptional regulator n=1 Tax=Rothia sp. LK2588 TaxID=3114369 RepID=UPI0034CF5CAF
MDLESLVNAHQQQFSQTEREILAFMLNNEQFVADSTITSLAHRTFTSTSSIIRLTKKLGFTGFAELKYFVKNSLAEAAPVNTDFIASGARDINKTLSDLTQRDLTEVVEKIHRARTVYCFGTGYAQRNAVQEFAKSMVACGKFTHVIPAKNEFIGSVQAMGEQDVVILVSLSGSTESVMETVRTLSLRKVPMIAITGAGINPMSHLADFSLHYETTPTRLPGHKTPYHSFVALTVLLDYLTRQYIKFLEEGNS